MKEVYNDLFSGELTAFNVSHGDASICDSLYNFCDVHNVLAHGDEKALDRAKYIVNAVNSYAEMYEMLETTMNILNGDDSLNEVSADDIAKLLRKARGEI